MLTDINSSLEIIENELKKLDIPLTPSNLYDPVRYSLSNGGKRLRPALTLLSCNLFSDDYMRSINPALGLEVFHNFTLLHDDLMDNSPVRRGDPTVHIRWGANTAILSGDVMLILAYKLISQTDKEVMPTVLEVFNKTALEVCEGQMMDMDFEERIDVSVDEYITMIGLKTSVLLAACMKIGALCGGSGKDEAEGLYNFGYFLGIGFQLQDDLLDTFGELEKFGKKIGNDILTNKKTYLFLKALELAGIEEKKNLLQLYSGNSFDPEEKISLVKDIFKSIGIPGLTEEIAGNYFSKANMILDSLNVKESRKSGIKEFVAAIIKREK